MSTTDPAPAAQAAPAAQPDTETLLQKAEKFVENVALRLPAKFAVAIPAEKVSQQVLNGTLTEAEENGKVVITWTPNP